MPGQRAIRIIDLERRRLDLMRAALRAYQLSEFRYVHRSIACTMKAGNAAPLPHKTAEAVQDLRIGENLSIAAVEEHGVVVQNFRDTSNCSDRC